MGAWLKSRALFVVHPLCHSHCVRVPPLLSVAVAVAATTEPVAVTGWGISPLGIGLEKTTCSNTL